MVVLTTLSRPTNLATGLTLDPEMEERVFAVETDIDGLETSVSLLLSKSHPFDQSLVVDGFKIFYPSQPTNLRLGDDFDDETASDPSELAYNLVVNGYSYFKEGTTIVDDLTLNEPYLTAKVGANQYHVFDFSPDTLLDPGGRVLTRAQLDYLFDQHEVGTTSITNLNGDFVLHLEDGTTVSHQNAFSVINDQDVRVQLPYNVTNGDASGICKFTYRDYHVSQSATGDNVVDGTVGYPYFSDAFFGLGGSRFNGLPLRVELLSFATIRDDNRRLPLTGRSFTITRTYSPLTDWRMGPIEPLNAIHWSTTLPNATWEVVEGTTLKQGIKMTTPFAYQRKLPIRWYMNSTQLTPTTPTIGGVSLSKRGTARGRRSNHRASSGR
eukprot:jgi/Mesvir1/194/Mv25420-RA.1